jgi:hypothetical protein
MIKQPSLFPTKILLLLVAITLVGYFIYTQFADRLTAPDQLAAATSVFSKGETLKSASNTVVIADNLSPALTSGVATTNVARPIMLATTYLPGLTRAQANK